MAEDSTTSDLRPTGLGGERSNGRPPPPPRSGPTICQVSHDRNSAEMHFSRESTAELLASGGFFWLDLDRPEADDFEILREVFGFHPLAVEDSEYFDQRAKIDDHDDFVFLVVYGASPDDDRRDRRARGSDLPRGHRQAAAGPILLAFFKRRGWF